MSLNLDDAYYTKLYVAYIEKHSSLVFKIVQYTLEKTNALAYYLKVKKSSEMEKKNTPAYY